MLIERSASAFQATAGRWPRSAEEVAAGARTAGARFDANRFSHLAVEPAADRSSVLRFTTKGVCGATVEVPLPPPAATRP